MRQVHAVGEMNIIKQKEKALSTLLEMNQRISCT